ncbi:MAG: hypothetical protein HPY83_10145 [Anaerolineae bacterium]|nr:hypothetical protein [Anaerolineae bacterium]
MRQSSTLSALTILIVLLALLAAGTGLLYRGEGSRYQFTTLRGETVEIYGRGLYRYEPVLMAAQVMPQDAVTLAIGVPLLLVSLWLYRRGSWRGLLLLTGTLAYFLYTYTSMAFGAAFNELFLVYVALFSLSVFAFTVAMLSVDLRSLAAHFREGLPRRAIAAFLFVVGGFLSLAWLGRIVPAQLAGEPPIGLATNTTLFIQVLDLGLVVPLAFLAGVLLLRRRPLGYLLTSVALIKFVTMGLALVAMIVGQAVAGVPMAAAEVVVFPLIAGTGIVMAYLLLRNVQETSLA